MRQDLREAVRREARGAKSNSSVLLLRVVARQGAGQLSTRDSALSTFSFSKRCLEEAFFFQFPREAQIKHLPYGGGLSQRIS